MGRKKRKRWEYAQLWTRSDDNDSCLVEFSSWYGKGEGKDPREFDHLLSACRWLGKRGWEMVSYCPEVAEDGYIFWHAAFKREVRDAR